MNTLTKYINQQLKNNNYQQITLASWVTIPNTTLIIQHQETSLIYSIKYENNNIHIYYLHITKHTGVSNNFEIPNGWEKIYTADLNNPNTDPDDIIKTITNHTQTNQKGSQRTTFMKNLIPNF